MEMLGPPAAGQLLISAQVGGGDYFDRSVVLVLEHDDDGTVGVVLGKVSDEPIPDTLSDWVPLLSPPAALYEGGPVNQDGLLVLAQLASPASSPPGWQRLFDDVGVINLSMPLEVFDGAFAHVRMFLALAGWSAGQLESELIRGSWFRTMARTEEVFGVPDDLWRRVVRRMGGAVGRWSTWTEDPQLN